MLEFLIVTVQGLQFRAVRMSIILEEKPTNGITYKYHSSIHIQACTKHTHKHHQIDSMVFCNVIPYNLIQRSRAREKDFSIFESCGAHIFTANRVFNNFSGAYSMHGTVMRLWTMHLLCWKGILFINVCVYCVLAIVIASSKACQPKFWTVTRNPDPVYSKLHF